jgi:hypothetical protein
MSNIISSQEKTRICDILLYLFFFFMPTAYTYPGRIYYHFTNLHGYKDFSLLQLLTLPSIVFSLLMIATRVIKKDYQQITKNTFLFGSAISLWCLVAGISLISNFATAGVGTNFVAVYLTALLIYIALMGYQLNEQTFIGIFVALALGSLYPLASGITEYYLLWGIPDTHTLIYSHYDLVKMQPYFDLTFGNTGNTAAFLMLVMPAFLALLILKPLTKPVYYLLVTTLILGFLNLLITESRAALLLFSAACFIVCYLKNPKTLLIATIIFLVGIFLLYCFDSEFLLSLAQRMKLLITMSNTHDDISVAMREGAWKEGWDIFMQHFKTGVGPGANFLYNSHFTAHQFNIEQASELGIGGFIVSIYLSLLILIKFARMLLQKSTLKNNNTLIFLIGPACYIGYGLLANMALTIGIVNTWIALTAAMLALTSHTEYKTRASKLTIENFACS